MKISHSIIVIISFMMFLSHCAKETSLSGTGSGAENAITAKISGVATTPDGKPLEGAEVTLRSTDYDPVKDSASVINKDTTDSYGAFRLTQSGQGFSMDITAKDSSGIINYREIVEYVSYDSTDISKNIELKPATNVSLIVPDTFIGEGIWLKGSGTFVEAAAGDTILFNGVPKGRRTFSYYEEGAAQYETTVDIIGDTIITEPSTTPSVPVENNAATSGIYPSVTDISLTINGPQIEIPIVYDTALSQQPTILWSSLDSSIATVSDGLVTGIAPGQTAITGTDSATGNRFHIAAVVDKFLDLRGNFAGIQQIYPIAHIAGLYIFRDNLNYFINGGTQCFLQQPFSCQKYGTYGKWDSVQVACPEHWRLPSHAEFEKIAKHIAIQENIDTSTAGSYDVAIHLKKHDEIWNIPLTDPALGSSKFDALPGGLYTDWIYSVQYDTATGFWTSTEHINTTQSYPRDSAYVWFIDSTNTFKSEIKSQSDMYYIRCLWDKP